MIYATILMAILFGFALGMKANNKLANQKKVQNGLIKLGLSLHKASKKDIERAEGGIIKL